MKKFKVELGVWQFNMPAEIKRVCKTEALLAEKSNGFNNKGKGIIVCVEDDKVEEFKTLYIKGVEKYKNFCESNGYVARSFGGLVEVTGPATVQSEVKAAEVKEEIVEEETMSEKTYTKAEVDAIVKYLKDSMSVKEVVKTVYPADYESLKKELEASRKTAATWQSKYTELEKKYNDLMSSAKEVKPVETAEKHFPSKKEELPSVTADYDDTDESYYSEDNNTPFIPSTLPAEVTGRKEEDDRKDAKYLLDEEGYGYKYITDDNFVENLQKANNTQKFGLNYFVYEFARYTEATGRKVNNVYDAVLAIAKQAETMKGHEEKTFSFMIDRFCTAKNQTHFGVVLYTTPELRALLHDLDLANAKALCEAKLGL